MSPSTHNSLYLGFDSLADKAEAIRKAADEYTARQNRDSHPEGSFDSAGRFYLDEKCPHCSDVRSPTRAYPYSEMIHGRSMAHVAHLFGVTKELVQTELTERAHAERKANREAVCAEAARRFLTSDESAEHVAAECGVTVKDVKAGVDLFKSCKFAVINGKVVTQTTLAHTFDCELYQSGALKQIS